MAKKWLPKERMDFELFDISDVTHELKFKGRREISIKLKASDSDFNLMKYWLSLRDHVEKVGLQLGMFVEQADEDNPQW